MNYYDFDVPPRSVSEIDPKTTSKEGLVKFLLRNLRRGFLHN